uniref:Uncharacterized protein n=1 Tax=Micrurus lemniscatus lemniscatus TaxID=129467 RepID=A0A2D4IIN9_MICLE
MEEHNHTFSFQEAEVVARDITKEGCLLKEAWFSNSNSINRHIELPPAYQALRHQERPCWRSRDHFPLGEQRPMAPPHTHTPGHVDSSYEGTARLVLIQRNLEELPQVITDRNNEE